MGIWDTLPPSLEAECIEYVWSPCHYSPSIHPTTPVWAGFPCHHSIDSASGSASGNIWVAGLGGPGLTVVLIILWLSASLFGFRTLSSCLLTLQSFLGAFFLCPASLPWMLLSNSHLSPQVPPLQ